MRASPLQNRVTPAGELIATPARGTMMGNRGIIHDPATKTLLTRRWQHQAWICCVLEFKSFQHPIMGPGAYTELFFLDEATALAAGHRPCAYCRRPAFNAFLAAWRDASGDPVPRAPKIDRQLHRERVTRQRDKVTFTTRLGELPNGTFVLRNDTPCVRVDHDLYPWTASGYGAPVSAPGAIRVEVLTPRSIVETLRCGYVPALHPGT